VSYDGMVKLFFDTAKERYRIKQNRDINHAPFWRYDKQAGEDFKHAWTDDRIFQDYRFCNVFREDDKVTRWFRENIRAKMQTPAQHVRAAVAFRWFNLPATGELLLPWLLGEAGMTDALLAVRERAMSGENILNAAYMIKSPPGLKKADGIFRCMTNVEEDMEGLAESIMAVNTLEHAVQALCQYPYLGPFMAYQSVCDLRFTPVLEHAMDLNYWTAPGPGSARGIGRVFHDDPKAYNYNSDRDKKVLINKMGLLLFQSHEQRHWPAAWPKWELSTVQHWACEFDKYCRVLNGEGEPKQRYKGIAG
jgi:hypothetical protein